MWSFDGLSDGPAAFGATIATGDYARGATSGGVFSGGLYGLDSLGNQALMVQATGSDFTPGEMILKVQNNTGMAVNEFVIGYDLLVSNDNGRANSFNLSYSTDGGTTYVPVPAVDFTTVEVADATPSFIAYPQAATVSGISVAMGADLLLKWTGEDVSGAGSRDEVALDNIAVTLNAGAVAMIMATDDAASTAFNNMVTVPVLANDMTPNGVTSLTVISAPVNGGATTVTAGNDIEFTPNFGFCGTDMFEYQVCDAMGCDTGMVTVTIACPTTYPQYPIATVHTEDANGVADSIGVTCELTGVVHCGNFRSSGLQFTFNDGTGGIGLFSGSQDWGYTVTEGDMVTVQGTISQFNGLTQINPDTVWFVSAGNPLVGPTVVTDMDETTESELITFNNVTLVNPAAWNSGGGSFNMDFTDGTTTWSMRIDSDTDLAGIADPIGTNAFDVTGICGQFDNSSPYDSGYQLFPCGLASINVIPAAMVMATNDVATTDQDVSVVIPVLANDATPNGVTSVTVITFPSSGLTSVNGANEIVYVPTAGTCGMDMFEYEVCDAMGCDTAMVNITVNCPAPTYSISQVTGLDANGVADSLMVTCQLQGIVHGVDLRGGNGYQFMLHDGTDGIGVFAFADFGSYVLAEGDEVAIIGDISQFNGLTQINPDTIIYISSGNALFGPNAITTGLDETTESELVDMNGCFTIDPSTPWDASGSSFNMTLNEVGGSRSFDIRIDNDTDLAGIADPTGGNPFNVIGIGGQFDSSSPFDSGYQLFPRYLADIQVCLSANEVSLTAATLAPNPASNQTQLSLENTISEITIISSLGQIVKTERNINSNEMMISLDGMTPGIYMITGQDVDGARFTTRLIVQ